MEATEKVGLRTLGDERRDVLVRVSGASGRRDTVMGEARVQGESKKHAKSRKAEGKSGQSAGGARGRSGWRANGDGGDRVARRSLGETWCSRSQTNNGRRRFLVSRALIQQAWDCAGCVFMGPCYVMVPAAETGIRFLLLPYYSMTV